MPDPGRATPYRVPAPEPCECEATGRTSSHAASDRAAINLDVPRLPTRVLTVDVIDRLTRRRETIRADVAAGKTTREYQDAYEDALDDLLDAFYGFCHPDIAIKEAP